MSDLIRSLRKASRLLTKNVDSYIKVEETLPHQAADLIEQQQTRIEGLENAVTIWKKTSESLTALRDKLYTERDELAAAVELLKAQQSEVAAQAVEEILNWDHSHIQTEEGRFAYYDYAIESYAKQLREQGNE